MAAVWRDFPSGERGRSPPVLLATLPLVSTGDSHLPLTLHYPASNPAGFSRSFRPSCVSHSGPRREKEIATQTRHLEHEPEKRHGPPCRWVGPGRSERGRWTRREDAD